MYDKTNIKTYDNAVEYLDNNAPEYLPLIFALGTPVANESINTLMVTTKENDKEDVEVKDIELHINPNYEVNATPQECAAMLIHEAIHVYKNHLGENATFKDVEQGKLVIAHESITNDYLEFIGFELPSDLDEDGNVIKSYRDKYIFGSRHVGYSTIGMSTQEVLDVLPDEDFDDDCPFHNQGGSGDSGDSDDSSDSNNSSGSGDSDSSDSDSGQEAQDIYNAFMNYVMDNIDDIPEDMADDIEMNNPDFNQSYNIDNDSSVGVSKSGSGFDGKEANYIAEKFGTTVEWLKFLHEICPDFLKKSGGAKPMQPAEVNWTRPNLRAGSLPSNCFMPSYSNPNDKEPELSDDMGNHKPRIVIGLDTSGSISSQWVNSLRNLIGTIPTDLIEVDAFTFSTQCHDYNVDSDYNYIERSGTDFRKIKTYLNQIQVDPSKSQVIIISDGEDHPTGQSDEYMWLLFDRSNVGYMRMLGHNVDSMNIRFVDEFFDDSNIHHY